MRIGRHLKIDLWIVLQRVINLLKTRWAFRCFRDRERKSHGFVFFDVGVLADNDDLKVFECRLSKSIEDECLRRVANLGLVLMFNVAVKVFESFGVQRGL